MSKPTNTEQPIKDFSLPMVSDQGMENIKLSEFSSDKKVVLAFFPGAYAPVCVKEMEELKKHYPSFKNANAEVLGISGDLPWALAKFRKDSGVDFPLVSDSTFAVSKDYGLYLNNPMGNGLDFSNRGIFIVDKGKITYEWKGEDPTKLPDFDEISRQLKS